MMGTNQKNFNDARSSCEQLGGFLAEPRSAEVSTAVKTFTFQTEYLWLGLYNMEGTFLWKTDNAELSYTDWEEGRPNDYGGVQDCVGLNRNAKWDDRACDQLYDYLCQANKRKSLFITNYCVCQCMYVCMYVH